MSSTLRTRPSGPIDAADFGRRVRELVIDGTSQIARRADVPRLVEAGRDSAAAAVSDAMDRVPGRRRRRRPSPLVSVSVLALLLALGLGAWWFVRTSGSMATLLAIDDEDEDNDDDLGATVDQALDAEAVSRATDEGMGTAWDGMTAARTTADMPTIPVPPEGGPAEVADRAGELHRAVVGMA